MKGRCARERPLVRSSRILEVLRNIQVRDLADKKFQLFTQDPFNPSLGLKQKGNVWTVDVSRSYRAIALRQGNDFHWFWVGSHEAYNHLLRRLK